MLPRIRVASPCTANWEKMTGDDRVRYCDQCKLSVYNFSAMSSTEIEELLAERTGRVCGRLYQRTDGTILTKDCPVGFRFVVRRVSRVAATAIAAMMSVSSVTAQNTHQNDSLLQIQQMRSILRIVVIDETGALIPRSELHLQNESGRTFDATTGPFGDYLFSALEPGNYVLRVQGPPGFGRVQKPFQIRENIPERLEITLTLQLLPTMGVVFSADNGLETGASDFPMPNFLAAQPMPPPAPPPVSPHRSFLFRLLRKLHF
jgi:hypothetical protein